MSDQEDDDKQFEASQKKLDDAREKGEIPRSADMTTAAGYGGFLLAALVFGAGSVTGLGTGLSALLDRADIMATMAFDGSGTPIAGGILGAIGGSLSPWFALPATLALLSILVQRSFVMAPSRLVPKLSRISPVEGAKNKFGRAGLFEFLKSLTKLALYSIVLGVYLTFKLPRIIATLALEPGQIATELAQLSLGLLLIVLLVALGLGLIDLIWQHGEHARKNRMSRQELLDEMKASEGDPAIKQQRRQKGIAIAMNQMLADVPSADVVIVNPTHFAVALKWSRASGKAPICVAKGVDDIAAKIREIAAENAVPIHSDPPTARALYASSAIGDEISPTHYRAVAAAIRFAERIRARARKW
jgi:flagellar biosynthetic protein FlhB